MKEKLEQRLLEIKKAKEQTLAQYNALCGAEQTVTEILAEVNEEREQKGKN